MKTVSIINPGPAEQARNVQLVGEFREYLQALVAKRKADPGDDALSQIVTAGLDGEPVTDTAAQQKAFELIAGGVDTTRQMISHIVLALASRPDQRALARERPELAGNAVDEVLRLYPIVWSACRTAVERTEIGGQVVEKDAYVALFYPSGNRDEKVWINADQMDVKREADVDHVAFGHGEHFCPGAVLARLEGRIVLEEMLARFPNWRVLDSPVRMIAPSMNGVLSMHIELAA